MKKYKYIGHYKPFERPLKLISLQVERSLRFFKLSFYSWLKFQDKCDLCKNRLRKTRNDYYGVVEVPNTISGNLKTSYNLCNLCYFLYKRNNMV